MTIVLAGATGTIGRAVLQALRRAQADVLALVRPGTGSIGSGVETAFWDLDDPTSVSLTLQGRKVDAVLSCLASRTGAPNDAWAVDYAAQSALLTACHACGAQHFVLLSAICVQKPKLAFQHAKLAFEAELQASGLDWTIVRPTAFFKSLSGQVARVQAGKPFMFFGDGRQTACLPISDRDLADYIFACLQDPACRNRVLPIGGPGVALTPRDQADMLFDLLGQTPRYRSVPVAMMDGLIGGLSMAARFVPRLKAKAEFARIGRYYATESMLVWDAKAQQYRAECTPQTGHDTLRAHYTALLSGAARADLGAHAAF